MQTKMLKLTKELHCSCLLSASWTMGASAQNTVSEKQKGVRPGLHVSRDSVSHVNASTKHWYLHQAAGNYKASHKNSSKPPTKALTQDLGSYSPSDTCFSNVWCLLWRQPIQSLFWGPAIHCTLSTGCQEEGVGQVSFNRGKICNTPFWNFGQRNCWAVHWLLRTLLSYSIGMHQGKGKYLWL